jgi:hypothetical protein
MEPRAAAEIANGLAHEIVSDIELATALGKLQKIHVSRLLGLANALVAVASKMEPQAATEIANWGAQRLVATLRNPQETDSFQLLGLGDALAAFCSLLPSAHHTHLLALSNMLLQPVPEETAEAEDQPYVRTLLANVCAQLSAQDLAEVLKYPFCTGEAEQIVLNQLKANDAGTSTGTRGARGDKKGTRDLSLPLIDHLPTCQLSRKKFGQIICKVRPERNLAQANCTRHNPHSDLIFA